MTENRSQNQGAVETACQSPLPQNGDLCAEAVFQILPCVCPPTDVHGHLPLQGDGVIFR